MADSAPGPAAYGPVWPVAPVLPALPLWGRRWSWSQRTRDTHPPLTCLNLGGQSSLYQALCATKGVSYCDFFFFIIINKCSEMADPIVCFYCTRSGPGCWLGHPCFTGGTPWSPLSLQLSSWGLPSHQQGHRKSPLHLSGIQQIARAGWAQQAWHRLEPATPSQ